jgi:hypothetical protein
MREGDSIALDRINSDHYWLRLNASASGGPCGTVAGADTKPNARPHRLYPRQVCSCRKWLRLPTNDKNLKSIEWENRDYIKYLLTKGGTRKTETPAMQSSLRIHILLVYPVTGLLLSTFLFLRYLSKRCMTSL